MCRDAAAHESVLAIARRWQGSDCLGETERDIMNGSMKKKNYCSVSSITMRRLAILSVLNLDLIEINAWEPIVSNISEEDLWHPVTTSAGFSAHSLNDVRRVGGSSRVAAKFQFKAVASSIKEYCSRQAS